MREKGAEDESSLGTITELSELTSRRGQVQGSRLIQGGRKWRKIIDFSFGKRRLEVNPGIRGPPAGSEPD